MFSPALLRGAALEQLPSPDIHRDSASLRKGRILCVFPISFAVLELPKPLFAIEWFCFSLFSMFLFKRMGWSSE